ncbi:MAG: retention module-containing protein, partial [Methylotenera sp.]
MAIVGKVVALTGTAYIITDNGDKRELQLGDAVQTSDTIQTMAGAEVELDMTNGRSMRIGPDQLVAFTPELTNALGFNVLDGEVNLATIETVIKAIESGKDINEVLEETAAGSGGGSNEHGYDFLALLRIVDPLNQFGFNYDFNFRANIDDQPINGRPLDDNGVGTVGGGGGTTLPANNAPTITVILTNNFIEDAPGNALGNIIASYTTSDADLDTVTVTLSDTTHYALDGLGNVTLTAAGLALVNAGTDLPAFTLTPNDGSVNGTAANVDPTVTPVNDAPIANPDTLNIDEDTTNIPLNLLANDSDPDGTTPTIQSINGVPFALGISIPVPNGTVNISATGVITFTPDADFDGTINFPYVITDGVTTANSTVTVNVAPVNDAPIANADIASTPINTAINNINVKGNDTDVDNINAQLTVSAPTLANPALGTVTLNPDSTINFTPATGITGPVIITYTVTDPGGLSSTGTLTVNVGANNPPDSADITKVTNEDTSLVFGIGDFAFNDPDAAQTLNAVRIDSLPTNGTLTLNGNPVVAGQVISDDDIIAGNLVFTPAADANGINYANFTFSVQDSAGAFDTVPNTLTIDVTPVNNDPTVFGGNTSGSGAEDGGAITGTLTATDADGLLDGTIFSVTGAATHGTASINPATGAWTYTPTADYNGLDNFTVTVTDDAGNTSTQVIALTVTAVADIVNDAISTNEDTAITANVLTGSNGASADNFEGTPSVTSVTQGANGTVTFLANGSVTYTPNANFSGTDSFSYTVTSPAGVTETATVNVTVNAANDPTVFGGNTSGSGAEDGGAITGTLTATDADGL